MLYLPEQKQSVTQIISSSFKGYIHFFPQFFLICLIAAIVNAGLSCLAQLLILANSVPAMLLTILIYVASIFISMIFSSAIYYFLYLCISQQTPSIADSLNRGVKVIWSVLLAAILIAMFLLGGFIFFVIPGVIMTVYIILYQPLIVIYNYKSTDALYTSFRLIRHNWWRTLGFLILLMIMALAPILLFVILASNAPGLAVLNNLYVQSLLMAIYQFLVVPLTMLALLYLLFDLRVRELENRADIEAVNKADETPTL